MKRLFRTAAINLWILLLSACGGSEPAAPTEATTAAATAAVQAAQTSTPISTQAQATAASPIAALDVTLLLDWAEREYPQYFPGHQDNLQASPYVYRYYPSTRNYVGVAGDDVYILGPLSNNLLTRVGSREDFRCRVQPSDCAPPGYARAGWVATLSMLQHGVSGKVTIVDARTLRLTEFNYDAGGPQVYAYLGSDNSNAAFFAGRIIGPRLNRGSPAYVNATLELQLPEGQTLDGYNALSIWCVEFRANFGSGAFKAPPAPAAAL